MPKRPFTKSNTLPFNVLERSEMQGAYLNTLKEIYSKPIATIKLRETQSNSIKIRTRKSCPFSSYLFNIVLEVLARAIRQLSEIKEMQIEKEEVKVSLFKDGIRVYMSDSKNST